MKKNCNTCTHRTEIDHSHRISCSYFWKNKNMISESPLHKDNVPEYAKENGWFDFPYDFDPIWVDSDCSGHKDTNDDVLYTMEF